MPEGIGGEGEGFYRHVREDGQLRERHIAALLSTPGYGHLSEEQAGETVDQMLRLTSLLYGVLRQESAPEPDTQ